METVFLGLKLALGWALLPVIFFLVIALGIAVLCIVYRVGCAFLQVKDWCYEHTH